MKKIFLLIACAAVMLVSCKKEVPKVDPTLSITADATFAEDNSANLKLTLSAAAEQEVVVNLAEDQIQSGKVKAFVNFPSKVSIAAGKTEVNVPVTVDVQGLTSGDYQAAIKVASVTGAIMPTTPTVYINLKYVFKPIVSIMSSGNFDNQGNAKLTVSLAAPTTVDVIVALAEGTTTKTKLAVTFDKNITIPAGETSKEVPVKATIKDLAVGEYESVIKIESVQNGIASTTINSATIGYVFSLTSSIVIDGNFSDWDSSSNIQVAKLPDGDVVSKDLKVLKIGADGKYLYFYFEMAYKTDDPWNVSIPCDFFVDSDGDPSTGYVNGDSCGTPLDAVQLWTPMGCEWYSEYMGLTNPATGTFEDFTDDPATGDPSEPYRWLKYTGANGASFWTAFSNEGAEEDTKDIAYAKGTYSEGVYYCEAKFSRKKLGATGTKLGFGMKPMVGWATNGLLPQGNIVNGVRQSVDMLRITMPEYKY
jgi:hypothetical protein